ncbi:hypothetical protein LY85_1930 [Clostridium sp. KNHs216]|nr:hypothetical protein LY85_1930 [Clostridium sp. KNHs216]
MEKGKRCAGCRKMFLAVCVLALVLGLTSCGTLGVPSGNFPDETSVVSGGNSLNETGMVSGLEEIPEMTADAEIRVIDGDVLYAPKTWKEENELSQYIVRGSLLDDAKQKLERHGQKFPVYGVTVSSFRISQVYKGNLNPGDVIPIAERYYTVKEEGKIVRYELGYAPSIPDKEYIFFLIPAEDKNEFLRGTYGPMIGETARYPVVDPAEFDVDSKTAEELNLVVRDVEDYRAIYKEVIRKYMR